MRKIILLFFILAISPKAGAQESISTLGIAVEDVVDVQVMDPQGNITGTDFSSGKELEQIPGAKFFTDYTQDAVTREALESTHFVEINNPHGSYTIRVEGVRKGAYHIQIFSPDLNNKNFTQLEGRAFIGKTDTYTIKVK